MSTYTLKRCLKIQLTEKDSYDSRVPSRFNQTGSWIATLTQRHKFGNINVVSEGKQLTYFERPEMEA